MHEFWMRKRNKLFIFVACISVIFLGVTYAFLNQTLTGAKRQAISSGTLQLEFQEGEAIALGNAMPIYDEVGMIQKPFTFKLVNNGNIPINYIVRLVDITSESTEKLDTNIVKYGLTKDDVDTIDFLSNLENSQIDNGMILANQTIQYDLRLWIDFDVEDEDLIHGKSLSYRIDVEAGQVDGTKREIKLDANGGQVSETAKTVVVGETYGKLPIPTKEDSIFLGWFTEISGGERIENTSIINASDNHILYAHWKDSYQDKSGASHPVLSEELIPVKIANNGTVTKASIYEEWYDYDKQVWANAVILLDKSIIYSDNQVIPESNIESYFVWIPRYRYKIFNDGNYTGLTSLNSDAPQTIEIEFETKDTPVSNGTTKDAWLSHPAFQDFDTNGFWVGKFESGYKGATSTTTAQVNSADSTKLQIKPNVYSWRNITIGNAFKVSYDYKRELESHMIKNTEWGAVAYLQHSKYGSCMSVRVNNNNSSLTGYAAVEEPTLGYNSGTSIDGNKNGVTSDVTQPYNTIIGYKASTTANISGVYDMSGGSWEYVMGYNTKASSVGGSSGITSLYSDFFGNSKWNKYYNQYSNTDETVYTNRILGDATGEMGPFENKKGPDGNTQPSSSWHDDLAFFITTSYSWFRRGACWRDGVTAGVFAFTRNAGGISVNDSFRVVLVPTG